MVQLSLIEEIKDRASRLIPTAYMEIVEECTAPHLLIPTYEHVKFLCDTVNRKPEAIIDVVRALRRRITDANVAVKHLTIQLLEPMFKNCPTPFHIQIAAQKGLLRDLVAVGCLHPTTGRAMQAKEAALLLILNLSIWFRGHPARETHILTTLADDVRKELGPNCFEGLEPQRDARIKVQVNAPNHPRQQSEQQADASRGDHGPRSHGQRRERRSIVNAIPIDLPTPERVSAMLETCIAFSEYVSNAEMNPEMPMCDDEVVQSYMSQVRKDHEYVTILLSSNLQVDRDLQQTVSESQSAVMKKVEDVIAQQKRDATLAGQPTTPSARQHTAVRSAGDTEQPFGSSPSLQVTAMPLRDTPPHAEIPSGTTGVAGGFSAPVASPPSAAAPTVEDLFGGAQSAPQAAALMSTSLELSSDDAASAHVSPREPSSERTAAAAAPSLGDDAETPSGHVHAATLPSPTEPQAMEEAEAEEAPTEPQAMEEAEAEEASTEPQAMEEAEAEEAPAEPQAMEEAEAEEAPTEPQPSALESAPMATTPPRDDDDFDAFLESHTGS
ncbi:hypothetical protein JKF63_00791 [Porcisia hertigi]|uniref:VHS domain-containing protein n=1 Tax=Porcisia hertigi TaxID=2761500 RepID=A0A836KXH6_9TRYP|nr:hypothetical protein JKF63_00791 [Porcisia hertigi]